MNMGFDFWRLGMNILAPRLDAGAIDVVFDGAVMRVALADGREIAAPLE
jgi:hypothetical protein